MSYTKWTRGGGPVMYNTNPTHTLHYEYKIHYFTDSEGI